jgi:hypothetical protein
LSRGKVLWGVGSDDSHIFAPGGVPHVADPGQAWIMVHAPELSAEEIRAALRRGEFYASTGVVLDRIAADAKQLTFTIVEEKPGAARYTTRFVGQDGRTLAQVSGTHPVYHITGAERYVRASVIDSNGNRAWTQPVFLDGRASFVRGR